MAQQAQTPLYQSNQSPFDFGDSVSLSNVHSVVPDRPIPSVPKKNNKFSTLIKSNEESYLLGTRMVNVPESEKIYIEESDNSSYTWIPTGENYSCVVTSPKKESKLKGLKSFIVYQLTPTVNISNIL